MKHNRIALMSLAASLVGAPALAEKVVLKDPRGDDKGPGKYTYPTDTVYKKGSFDLTEFTIDKKDDKKAEFSLSFNSDIEDPWKMGAGFSVQMVFIFVDADGKEGSGHTEGLPGLNVKFASTDAWERVFVVSPQAPGRVRGEADNKAPALKSDVAVAAKTKASGRKISGNLDISGLPGDPTQWRYQVLVQSNEGFPASTDLLTRKVNEYEGQHRFGGGNDGDCDPHFIDALAGEAKGADTEAEAQYKMAAYECAEDGTAKQLATLTTVGPGKRQAAEPAPAPAASPEPK